MEQYLSQYAEPEAAALEGLPDLPAWDNVVAVPACNETAGFLRSPPACAGRSLMILVINEMDNASQEVSLNNQALAMAVQERFAPLWQPATAPGLSLWQDPLAGRDLLMVDRFSDGRKLPAKGGVGHARKIGADLALNLIHRQRIGTGWIHCSDADVQLPDTYFTFSNNLRDAGSGYSALVYPFSHIDDPGRAESAEVVAATRLYKLSLRYYVAGMKYACSPYAFHTIGSTMAVSAVHYAQVRGFPRREAGEDFYLLNKLAKVGAVLELDEGPDNEAIRIESRRSDRVPFGTGAAVNRITALADPMGGFRFYDPAVFELLKLWLLALPSIWLSGSVDLSPGVFPQQQGNRQNPNLQLLLAGLDAMKTGQALGHAFRQSKSLDQFTRQLNTWFDAFRTLKLIHYLRDEGLPSISYAELETSALYRHLQTRDPDLLAFQNRLRKNPEFGPVRRSRPASCFDPR